jgi:dTMP kinase
VVHETAKGGKFIVLEGLDGSGISVQAGYLEAYLKKRGFRTFLTKEPTTGVIGDLIREALKKGWSTSFKSLQLLFCADRARHLEDVIDPALKKGKFVVCDRYLFSTLAYGFGAGVDSKWLYDVNKNFRMPDLTIFIDISPDVSVNRIGSGKEMRELFERRESLRKVRKAYLNLAKRFRFKIVNGEEGVQETKKEIEEVVNKFLR